MTQFSTLATAPKPAKNTKRVTKNRRLAVYIRDRFTCQACGTDLKSAMACCITLDHLEPRSEGGNNDGSNLVTLCWECNTTRGVRPWREFYPGGAVSRIEKVRHEPLNEALAAALIDGTAGDDEAESAR